MRIKKILNNNVVLVSVDNFKKEQIVMQNGLGFNKKVGDEIPEDSNQQVFILSDSLYKKYEHSTNNTDPIAAQIAEEVISYAEEKYQLQL